MMHNIFLRPKRAVSLMALAFLASSAASCAYATLPHPSTFTKGAKFTVSGYTSNTPMTGFPVLVRIKDNSPTGFAYSDLQKQNPADLDDVDLVFVDMDGNGLPFEIDTWNPSGTSLVWVKLPTMTNGTEFVMCWSSAASGRTVCADKPWSAYTGVWHMSEASGVVADSTGHQLDASPAGANASVTSVAVGGQVGNARQCATNVAATAASYLSIPNYDSTYPLGANFTVSGWFNISTNHPSSGGSDVRFFSRKQKYDITGGWETIHKPGTPSTNVRGKTSSNNIEKKNVTLRGTGWNHIAVVYNGGASYLYLNGAEAGKKTSGGTEPTENGNCLSIGDYAEGAASPSPFVGAVDECRLCAGSLTAEWIAADCATVTNAAFLTAGEAETYSQTDGPVVGVTVSGADIFYTNATIRATVFSRGAGATSAEVNVELAASNDFSSPLWSTNYTSEADNDARSFAITDLSLGTAYYVRAAISNNLDRVMTTSTTQFETRVPGEPAGTAMLVERGFSTIAATATVSSFGTGGESALVRLEASTDGFESVFAAGEEQSAALDAPVQVSVSGLAADTAYSLRVRVRNDWGRVAYLPLPETHTRAVPFATTGIGWEFSQDGSTIDITFGVSGVFNGATGSASLTYAGRSQGAQNVSSATTLTWSGITSAAGPAVATVELTAELDGRTYTQTYSATITAGSSAVSVTDIADHMTAATSVRVHAGDVITLPELSGTDSYIVGNKLFASLEGNVLTALRPGILGVHCVTANGTTTNTLAVIVLPEKIGDGEIYIYDETAVAGDNNGRWHTESFWEKVGSETRDSYPCRTNDIAIIPFYTTTTGKSINLNGDVILGALFFGGFQDSKATANLGTTNSQYTRKITFARTDGNPAVVQSCSSATAADRRASISFGNAKIDYGVDTVVSGSWDGTDTFAAQGRVLYGDNAISTIPEGVTVTFVEFDPQATENSQTFRAGRLVGGGTFWNRSAANIKIDGKDALADFTGLLRDSSRGNLGTGRSGPILVRTPSATNTLYELVGLVATSSSSQPEHNSTNSVGRFYTGWEPAYGATFYGETNWFPACGLVMHGGTHHSRATETNNWANAVWWVRERKVGERLDVACGFNYIYETERDTARGHPINWLEYNSLSHENNATLRITDPSRYSLASSAEKTNNVTILHGVSAFKVGAAGDPEASMSYPIVPWIAGPVANNDQSVVLFACFDEYDRYIRPNYHSDSLETWGPTDNAIVWSKDKTSINLSADLVLNSLVLDDSGISSSQKQLGEGRTLAITSGGLIFSNSGAVIGTENGGANNGALVLGDATHPAYVWAKGSSASSPNQIWANVSAPGGFVAAYTGHLVLGGDQTGIGGEIAVNAGTLHLGTAGSGCSLARDIPIRIYANATLKLPNASSASGAILKFDGAAGWFGKVEVPSGVAAKCRKAYWRDYPETEEWQPIPLGVYSGDETTAENTPGCVYDPVHFAGAGTVQVLKDDMAKGRFLIICL